MDDLLKRANANRVHAKHSAPVDIVGVLADIDACLGIKHDEEEEDNAATDIYTMENGINARVQRPAS